MANAGNGGIYDVKARLSKAVKNMLSSEEILEHNKELIMKFHDECFAEGLSLHRVLFYMNMLSNIAKWTGKDLDKMSQDELKKLVIEIRQKDYAPDTITAFNVSIKKFYNWIDGGYERVSWLKTHANGNHTNKLPEELHTYEDVKNLISTTNNVRDKAFIHVLWESGGRIGELLSLKIKNITFDQYGAVIIVHGKTGYRRVRLVSSVPHLSTWMAHHPQKDNPEAPLWVNVGTTHNGDPLDYNAARMRLRKLAKKAGIKKKVNPHMFRHSRATNLATHLTEAQMKEYFGWVQSSKMASIYVHLSGRDTDKTILRLYGKIPKEDDGNGQIQLITCVFCRTENSEDRDHCINCGRALNMQTAIEAEAKERKLLEMITPEMIEEMVNKRVSELLTQHAQQGGAV